MMTIEEFKNAIQEKKEQRDKLREEALGLLESDNVEDAQAKRDEIKQLDDEIAELEKQIEEAEESDESQNDEEVTEVTVEERTINRIEVPEKVTSEERKAFKNYLETRDIAG